MSDRGVTGIPATRYICQTPAPAGSWRGQAKPRRPDRLKYSIVHSLLRPVIKYFYLPLRRGYVRGSGQCRGTLTASDTLLCIVVYSAPAGNNVPCTYWCVNRVCSLCERMCVFVRYVRTIYWFFRPRVAPATAQSVVV